MLYASSDTTPSSSVEWHSHHTSYYQENHTAAPAQPPAVAEQTPSMLVDMILPRPIPAETALRMVRKTVQTLMYIRGQMGSTWEQLEFLMMQENARQEQESQTRDHANFHDPYLGTQNHASQDEDENDFVIPTKSLREFLETGQRTFVDLEESVYDQLYSDLRHSTTTPTPASNTTSTPPTPQRPRTIHDPYRTPGTQTPEPFFLHPLQRPQ
ncbi:hypothetical protein BGZ96_012814 [Linnemannia gamsii]|uniref:Uncharacterized protein n=1 Tax=Linnemannia gamsii TaxID=64522 RepID=A0ABQ7JQX1_9FUNG|nr:hypothetical protein BGZ96_012814 [Linnemannia gamsii]